MDMLGFLGKKVDLVCNDGKQFSGYVFDVSDAEDSDIGCDSVDIALLDREAVVVLPVEDITQVTVDDSYEEIDFWS